MTDKGSVCPFSGSSQRSQALSALAVMGTLDKLWGPVVEGGSYRGPPHLHLPLPHGSPCPTASAGFTLLLAWLSCSQGIAGCLGGSWLPLTSLSPDTSEEMEEAAGPSALGQGRYCSIRGAQHWNDSRKQCFLAKSKIHLKLVFSESVCKKADNLVCLQSMMNLVE